MTTPLRIAVQRSGRLHDGSVALLHRAGVSFETGGRKLFCPSSNFPAELMLVRDDDIPEYVASGICHAGVVGENVLAEHSTLDAHPPMETIMPLGFGRCRLAIAVPDDFSYENARSLQGLRVGTSYPKSLNAFLKANGVAATAVTLSGSVEIAPKLRMADAICDLVSTGQTLVSNNLREVETVFSSEAVFIRTGATTVKSVADSLDRLVQRLEGAIKAQASKYIMMNAPANAVGKIQKLIPGMESPTVVPLADGKVAIHAVAAEEVFWETMENLKAAGASAILVMPIEKIIA